MRGGGAGPLVPGGLRRVPRRSGAGDRRARREAAAGAVGRSCSAGVRRGGRGRGCGRGRRGPGWTGCGWRSTPTRRTCPACRGSCCATRDPAARWCWAPRSSSAPISQAARRCPACADGPAAAGAAGDLPAGGRDDVPFRSVASRLVRGGADRIDGLELDVLRPPTFARLGKVLRAARGRGPAVPRGALRRARRVPRRHRRSKPTSTDGWTGRGARGSMSPLRFGPSAGPRAAGPARLPAVRGPGTREPSSSWSTGRPWPALLVETGVPVLVLNACRSAYAEAPATPDTGTAPRAAGTRPAAAGPTRRPADVHDRIRAYGSLAAEVADAGVPGVVAMRYNVYVVTAAQFVADLYAAPAGRVARWARRPPRPARRWPPSPTRRDRRRARSRCRTGSCPCLRAGAAAAAHRTRPLRRR